LEKLKEETVVSDLPVNNPPLPISSFLEEIREQVLNNPITILEAAPGAGKSTEVPLALLGAVQGKILLLEPRRVAAKSLAEYLSSRLGEPTGKTVGYRMRGESKVSSETRLEIITEGLLTRMLIDDPSLPGISTIIFDEFHERSLQGDSSLAFSREIQRHLREDLRLLVMSATLESEKLRRVFKECSFISVPGRQYAITTQYLGAPERLERGVLAAINSALRASEGDILIFLPGRSEISRALRFAEEQGLGAKAKLLTLTADTPHAESAQLFKNSFERRIIFSSSVAETSVTLPAVRVVIDSGLSRYAVFNAETGMDELVTRRVSEASAEQRRGRAGRVAEGLCFRLWTEGERLLPQTDPEIVRGDLTTFALELSLFGVGSPEDLELLDYPQKSRWEESLKLLRNLGALDAASRITSHGKELARFGVHPRISHMLQRGKVLGSPLTAARIAALVESTSVSSDHLSEVLLTFSKESGRTKAHAQSLFRTLSATEEQDYPANVALLMAAAFPERLAKRTERGTFALASGGEVRLSETSDLRKSDFLAVGRTLGGRVALAEPITTQEIFEAYAVKSLRTLQVEGGRAVVREEKLVLDLVIESQRAVISSEERRELLVREIEKLGFSGLFSREAKAQSLISRVQWGLNHQVLSEEFSLKSFAENLADQISPYLTTEVLTVNDLPLSQIISSYLGFEKMKKVESLLPERLILATGTEVAILYLSSGEVVSRILLQELFGSSESPRIAGRAITLELLSPAKRTLQTTKDLRSFWMNAYPALRSELKRDYPRHSWPEDPIAANPVLKGLKRNER